MPPKEEKQLAGLMVQQRCLLKMLEALENFIADYDPERDQCQLCVRIESLDTLNINFAECQGTIERLDSPEELDRHIDERVEFEERYCIAKGFLLSKRIADDQQSVSNNTVQHHQQRQPQFHLRLPKIDLPKFNGDFS